MSSTSTGSQRERGDAGRGAAMRGRLAEHVQEQARGTIGYLRLAGNAGVLATSTAIFTSRAIALSDPAAAFSWASTLSAQIRAAAWPSAMSTSDLAASGPAGRGARGIACHQSLASVSFAWAMRSSSRL